MKVGRKEGSVRLWKSEEDLERMGTHRWIQLGFIPRPHSTVVQPLAEVLLRIATAMRQALASASDRDVYNPSNMMIAAAASRNKGFQASIISSVHSRASLNKVNGQFPNIYNADNGTVVLGFSR